MPWTRPQSDIESDEKSDDLSNVEKAAAFGAGGTGGGLFAFAMPDNWVGSPFYLLGQVISSLIPGPVGVIKDAQALLNSILDGDLAGIVLNGVALIPGLGSIAEGSQILKTITKWADDFPTSTDEALDLFMPLIKHMPDSIAMTVMAKFADGPVKSLRKDGMSADDILKYKQKGFDLRQIENLRHRGLSPRTISKYVDEGYSPRQISLMTDSGFKPGDLREFLDEGYSFGRIYRLHTNKGIPVDDIRKYVNEDISLWRISELRKRGISTDDIRYYVSEEVNLQRVADLRNQEISPANIRRYVGEGIDLSRVKRLRRQGVSEEAITTYVKRGGSNLRWVSKIPGVGRYLDTGSDLRRVSRLRHQDIPADDIKYYLRSGTSLKLVSDLRARGWSPQAIKDVIRAGQTAQLGAIPLNKYNTIADWCDKRLRDGANESICRVFTSTSQQDVNTDNDTNSLKNDSNRSTLNARNYIQIRYGPNMAQ